jgi:hypothetical protein
MEDVPSVESPAAAQASLIQEVEHHAGGRRADGIWQFFKKEQQGQGKAVYAHCNNSDCNLRLRVRYVNLLYDHIESRCKNRSEEDRQLARSLHSLKVEKQEKLDSKRKVKNGEEEGCIPWTLSSAEGKTGVF